MSSNWMHKAAVLPFAAFLGWLPAPVQAADPALERAAAAMGAANLKSLRYAGDGTGYTFGQAYKPGLAWPKINIRSFARTVNYDTGSGRKAKFQAVNDKLVLRDGARTVELHRIKDSHHTDSFLIVYLPKERLLIQADSFTPGPPNAPVPKQPNPNHTNLVDNLARLDLQVDRILPLHGRVVPLSDLYVAVGQPPPR